MASPHPGSGSVRPEQRPGVRGRWLAVADDGTVSAVCHLAGLAPLAPWAEGILGPALAVTRPRLVLLAAPPAGRVEMELVAMERRRRPSMRAVLVTQPDAVADRLHALALGFDDALPSSLPPEEILERARLLVTEPGRGGILPVADGVELDTDAHEVRRDGAVVHLRPKELALLAVLARDPGRAYTRRQLLDRAWGANARSDPRTVDVHVRWLRSKIEADPGHPVHLVTVRGVGYRLDPSPSLTAT